MTSQELHALLDDPHYDQCERIGLDPIDTDPENEPGCTATELERLRHSAPEFAYLRHGVR